MKIKRAKMSKVKISGIMACIYMYVCVDSWINRIYATNLLIWNFNLLQLE